MPTLMGVPTVSGCAANWRRSVFDAVDEVKATHPGDVITVAVTAVADVITAPVAPGVPVARRKTHEVLVDALAAGIELNTSAHRPRPTPTNIPQRINIDEEEDDDSNIRGGRGGGAGAVSAVFHGVSSSVGVNVREHPTRGFYAEGCVEIVAEDAEDCARLCSLALDGFAFRSASSRIGTRHVSARARIRVVRRRARALFAHAADHPAERPGAAGRVRGLASGVGDDFGDYRRRFSGYRSRQRITDSGGRRAQGVRAVRRRPGGLEVARAVPGLEVHAAGVQGAVRRRSALRRRLRLEKSSRHDESDAVVATRSKDQTRRTGDGRPGRRRARGCFGRQVDVSAPGPSRGVRRRVRAARRARA